MAALRVDSSPRRQDATRRIRALRVRSRSIEHTDHEAVLVEEPLEIRISGEPVATTLRTPGADRELALGYLYSEGAIQSAAEVAAARHCGRLGAPGYSNALDILPAPGLNLTHDPLERLRPRATISSACGACGRAQIAELAARASPLADDELVVTAAQVLARAQQLNSTQQLFSSTGGSHAAAVMTPAGELVAAAEDVGRHNAVDKVVGQLLLAEQLPARGTVLVVSSRAGFEIIQKACMARIPLVICLSAPTSLAVETAREFALTLVGFVRRDGFNVYSAPQRLAQPSFAGVATRGPRVA